jgi:hypothetical protein
VEGELDPTKPGHPEGISSTLFTSFLHDTVWPKPWCSTRVSCPSHTATCRRQVQEEFCAQTPISPARASVLSSTVKKGHAVCCVSQPTPCMVVEWALLLHVSHRQQPPCGALLKTTHLFCSCHSGQLQCNPIFNDCLDSKKNFLIIFPKIN